MVVKIKNLGWSMSAKDDLKSIALYYKKKVSITSSIQIIHELRTDAQSLLETPMIGQVEPLINDDINPLVSDGIVIYRYIISGHYKIVYYIAQDTIWIARIDECRQSPVNQKHLLNKQ